jgi:3-hydroxypropanoate dehydrogenase
MKALEEDALDQLFRAARTHNAWLPKPVAEATLRALYDLAKWGPTSVNAGPGRFVFVRSPEAKERLKRALTPGNLDKTMTAPVTVIVAYDLKFYEKLGRLFPSGPRMRELFAGNPQLVETTARRNSTLQGAYMMIAARALGLDCGAMSGFDNAKLDQDFFDAGRECAGCDQEFFPEGHVRSNFLFNLGYGDPAGLHPRGPRLSFEETCSIL